MGTSTFLQYLQRAAGRWEAQGNRSGIHPGALHRTSYRMIKYPRFD